MDGVTCDVCGKKTPPGDYCRNCWSKLAVAAPEMPSVAVETGPVPHEAEKLCGAPGCGQPLAEGATECGYCGEPVGAGASEGSSTLAFPWGSHALHEGEAVELGRAHPPFAGPLADYSNVGRTHARVVRAGGLVVTDLGSTNGTFVDNRRLPPNSPTDLHVGQVLRLAANLEIEIR